MGRCCDGWLCGRVLILSHPWIFSVFCHLLLKQGMDSQTDSARFCTAAVFENSCDIHSSCAQLLEQRGCPIRETGQWLYGSLAGTVACVSWGVPPLVSLDPIRLGQISHCSCIPGIPCCIEPAIYAALQARALCPESFGGGSRLSEIGFHLSRVGRVQGLLPLANAPSARLGHTRPDQVVRYCHAP